MAKGRLKKKIQNAVDKLGDKLQKDADDIASIEVTEKKSAPKKEVQSTSWKVRV